ncbi:hypothetical protein Q3G72_034653 [Acer saccharum]|nr:hypothetical protein Q3G72_034653 [Acer saccharum]
MPANFYSFTTKILYTYPAVPFLSNCHIISSFAFIVTPSLYINQSTLSHFHIFSSNSSSSNNMNTNMGSKNGVVFEDFFPSMVEKLGADGFMKELYNGFQLLMDEEKGVITLESLKRNSALLGMQDMSDQEVASMLKEGDLDGDGALNEMEFCTLMFRLSPGLMKTSRKLLVQAIVNEF